MFKHDKTRSQRNKQVRIGYLRMKRTYGEDFVQEQAAEIWKLTSEEQSRLAESGVTQVLSTEFVDKLTELFDSWQGFFREEEREWIKTNIIGHAEILTAISADDKDADQFLLDITPVRLRIRKLTPRECFRLMDVDEDRIDVIQASGISNSAQYKLAGNSIVVACLYYLFENLLFPPTEPQGDKYGQLSLF